MEKKRIIIALFAALLLGGLVSCGPKKNLRVFYWNIQQGMWCEQGTDYSDFVEYVASLDPDICVWCEAKSHYYTGTHNLITEIGDQYLPDNWDMVAARYGHKYVYVGGERDYFPQVITSKYPITNRKRLIGDKDSILVAHGAGWAEVDVNGRKINFVTVHTWPSAFAYGIPKEARDSSKAAHGGDYYRRKEMEYICAHTIESVPGAEKQEWIMLGDFNSVSRVDSLHFKYPSDDTRYLVHDYIRENTPYRDIVAEAYPGEYHSSHCHGRRIDFIYCTPPLADRVKSVRIIHDEGYVQAIQDTTVAEFYHPSDHYPILLDLEL